MSDIDKTNREPQEKPCENENNSNLVLMQKLDEQTIVQAVVMSEVLGKPKAKRRKRWHR